MDDREQLRETIRGRLGGLIEGAGKKREKIAKEMRISQFVIDGVMGAKAIPRIGTLIKFADYFDVRLDWILGRCDESEKYTKPWRVTERGTERMEAADRLTSLLEKHDMNPADLARAIGVSYGAVYSAAAGVTLSQPWIQMAYAEYFGTTVDWLLGMEEEK